MSSSPALTNLLSFDDDAAFLTPVTSNTPLPSSPSTSRTTTPFPASNPAGRTTLQPTPLASASVPLTQSVPRPAPRPAYRQIASTAPTPTSVSLVQPTPHLIVPHSISKASFAPESQSLPLPDDLLPFPYLSRYIANLPPKEREDEVARAMQLSEHERIQSDKEHEADYLLNANAFINDLDTVDYEILAQTIMLPNMFIRKENEEGMSGELDEAMGETPNSGYFDSTTPTKSQPSRAARIALNHVLSPPRAPSTATPIMLPFSTEHLSPNNATAVSYPLLPHPVQNSSAPKPTTSSLTTVVPLTAAEMAKFPDWLSSWYLNFSQLPYGQSWLKLVNQWTLLEKGYGFKSPVRTLM
jgi:hypothetical protein